MKASSLALLAGLCVALCGCASSIQVSQLDPATTPTGVPWNLAMTQYTVTISRQVTSCDGNVLEGTATVTAIASKKLDEEQQYVLKSDGVWATADITSTLAPDGTSTGLNAHSEDQTAAVIGNTIGLLGSVATATLAGGPAHFDCSADVSTALAELKPKVGDTLKQQVDKATAEVAAATEKVTHLTPLYANSRAKTPPENTALGKATTDLIGKQANLNQLQAKLTKNLKVITAVQTVSWPPRASESFTAAPFTLDPDVAQSWVKWSDLPAGMTQAPINTKGFDVYLGLYKTDGAGGWALPTSNPAVGNTKVGVPVRLARLGRLIACNTRCPETLGRDWVSSDTQSLLVSPDAPVLQYGQLYNVPLTGGTFKAEGAVIALDTNGVPTSIQVTEKQAAAAAATATAKSAAADLASLPGQIAAARLARTEGATKQINAANALAAAQAAAPYASGTADTNAQVAYLNALGTLASTQASQPTVAGTATANAQASYLNALTGLATARANADASGQLGQLAAQSAVAKQQVELANQQAGLASALARQAVAPAIDTLAANTSLITAQTAQINAEVAKVKAQAEMAK